MGMLPAFQGMYFEDFEVGQQVRSPGRTISEADIVAFAGLSGDFNGIHTDSEYAQRTNFGQRVAHGLLGLSIASGLLVRTGVLEGTVIAFREIKEWKFSQPIFIGDTIHVLLEVVEKKALPRLGGGSLLLGINVQNQSDETVMRGQWSVLVLSRPE
ncbi:MAG: MaoC/PaaZ C-terminal domain-containing protein [Anaerolineales bacterium]